MPINLKCSALRVGAILATTSAKNDPTWMMRTILAQSESKSKSFSIVLNSLLLGFKSLIFKSFFLLPALEGMEISRWFLQLSPWFLLWKAELSWSLVFISLILKFSSLMGMEISSLFLQLSPCLLYPTDDFDFWIFWKDSFFCCYLLLHMLLGAMMPYSDDEF